MPTIPVIAYQPRRRRRIFRTLRAFVRNTLTLWREFRLPVVTFLIVTLAGGYIYGELHEYAGLGELAIIDRPYIMLQLMILETPYDAPAEWYLISFWYALPLIFIFIVGNGVVDFVRLFFDRSHRNEAWRNAMVSTYRHHVIVLGAGHVGLRVINLLHEMGVDVVVIDHSPELGVQEFLDERKIPLFVADARIPQTLERAGLRDADAFVACTGDDHINLDAIMRARYMNPDIRIVARVWDDQFAQQIKAFMNVQAVLSSSGLSAPAFAGMALGVEITQSVNVNGIDYSTIRLTVNRSSFLEGLTVGQVQDEQGVDVVLYCSPDGKTEIHPGQSIPIAAGDTLVLFARYQRALEIAARNRDVPE